MEESELRQLFKNLSDIAHKKGGYTVYDKYEHRPIISAMSEDKFIEAIRQIKLLDLHVVSISEAEVCRCTNRMCNACISGICSELAYGCDSRQT